MKRYPPMRWAAINRVLAFESLTPADACKISQTLMAPMRTKVMPSQTLVELLSMLELCVAKLTGSYGTLFLTFRASQEYKRIGCSGRACSAILRACYRAANVGSCEKFRHLP